MFKKDEDLHGSGLEKPQSLSDRFANWWKMKNHKIAYKLLYMAQHGDKTERFKAVTALSSLSHLKGKFIIYLPLIIVFFNVVRITCLI